MLEVKGSQTATLLKTKMLEVLGTYGVTIHQIFSVTSDNGANMLAAVRKLKEELQLTLRDDFDTEEEADNTEQCDYTEELEEAFQERLNLVRCAVHSLQLVVIDVVKKSNPSVKEVTDIAKKCKLTRYKNYFEYRQASYPPVWCQTRWGGIFQMMESFIKQKDFFIELGTQFPELDLSNNWDFINDYVQAFRPIYICTKKMQSEHMSLSDFYMNWLIAMNEVQNIENNAFVPELSRALKTRLASLRDSWAFRMALYLDPRFNYFGSKVFTNDEKVRIQETIIDTFDRIKKLEPSKSSQLIDTKSETASLPKHNNFDEFFTSMFGGTPGPSAESSSAQSTFFKQLKALDVEPRQNMMFNPFQHWLNRKHTHPELYQVAMVVLAVPSNQVTVERSFSALGLVLSERRTELAEDTLSNILLIKLNKDVYEKILPDLYDWKDHSKESDVQVEV
ncbi:uncharacterized protein LOC129744950 [Uranotaenia lowii]|uniref:uncharacterized protein LOC129744950 n=1 Tax=Uranotaenia lowii TaxID=190385 RepID=UPI00247A9149|nr:uncharacterized protein LOC129744950 [Uranotaenia lowii]